MTKEIQGLFNLFIDLLNKKGYSTKGFKMDYNPIYGGYRIDIVNDNTSESDFDGLTRKSKKEMIAYLKGVIKGLSFN
jgi:hypothetical protein